jgi:HD-GYP domain-containing protein (c-di-GMP phosphodiesterase class II)
VRFELQLELLDRIGALVDAPPDLARTLPVIADAIAELLGAQGVIVAIRPRRGSDLVHRFARGVEPRNPAAAEVPIASDPLLELAVLSPRPLWVARYADSRLRDPHLERQGVDSLVAAPVACGEEVAGAIVALRTTGHAPLAQEHALLLRHAARELALVLATHSARRAHARAVSRERLLADAVARIANAPTLSHALTATVEGAAAVADGSFAGLIARANTGSRLIAATPGPIRDSLSRSAGGSRLHELPLAPLDGAMDQTLLARGRPVLVLDPAAFLGRLGLPGPALECAPLQGRMLTIVPIAGDDGADALLLVVIDDPSPEPGVFGPLETLAAHAAGVLRRARLHDDLEHAYLSTVTALANALEAKDADTHDHATETSRLAVAVGRRLGLRGADLRDLEFAAVLHDVGKIAIPDEILNRRGPLSAAEWDHVRDHTRIGERILRDIPFLAPAATAVRSAHERWDGNGYPDGLAGEGIPLAARIVFACDTWSVMTSTRPYRAALDLDEAFRRLHAAAGSQLDPSVVDTLVAVLDDAGLAAMPAHAVVRDAA